MGINIYQLIILIAIIASAIAMIRSLAKKNNSNEAHRNSEKIASLNSTNIHHETTGYKLGRTVGRAVQEAKNRAKTSQQKAKIDTINAKYDALQKLQSLHAAGIISDSEFEAEKKEITSQ